MDGIRLYMIIWTSVGLLLVASWDTYFCEIWVKIWQISYKNWFENVVYKMVAFLSEFCCGASPA